MYSNDNCIDGEQIQLSRMLLNYSVKKKEAQYQGSVQHSDRFRVRESEQRSELRSLRNLPTLPGVSTIDL